MSPNYFLIELNINALKAEHKQLIIKADLSDKEQKAIFIKARKSHFIFFIRIFLTFQFRLNPDSLISYTYDKRVLTIALSFIST